MALEKFVVNMCLKTWCASLVNIFHVAPGATTVAFEDTEMPKL